MPYSMIVYPAPLDARVKVTPDYSGVAAQGAPYTHGDGRAGQICYLPDDAPNQTGCWIELDREGFTPIKVHGFLELNAATMIARLQCDDFTMIEIPKTDDGGDGGNTGPSNRTPQEIINDVYNRTHPDLASHEGCGKFTEDCCTQLHNEHSQKWGHVGKNPGQNQYNGHAVDALSLLGDAKQTVAGTYDIIQNSVSVSATPAFNHVGPADPNLWYYPAAAAMVAYELSTIQQRLRSMQG